MAVNPTPKNTSSSDEIDLGQLFQMIGNGFNRIFNALLRTFLYLKKNAIVLGGLIILGVAIGFGLNQFVDKKKKTEVIVKPNLESKNYLYDVVSEIQANIEAKDASFFKALDISVEDLIGFGITVESASKNVENKIDIEYLELLEKFENTNIVSDVVRAEILNKSSLNHRISFYYKDAEKGQENAKKLMSYINSNNYLTELVKTYTENAKERIQKNTVLVKQLDELITNYSKKLAQKDNGSNEGRIVLDNEEQLDVKGLFELKNDLIRDTENKKLELQKSAEAISIINFGRPQQVQKAFYGKNIVLFPIILIGMFFLFSFLKYLNGKALEMQT